MPKKVATKQPIKLTGKRQGHLQIAGWLPVDVWDRLEAIKTYYGLDRMAAVKWLITDAYERIQDKIAKSPLPADNKIN